MTLLHWILSASGLILVVLALRALLGRRISAAMRYALWGVVLLRLLLPSAWFSPGVTVTLPEPPDRTALESISEESIYLLPIQSTPAEVWGDLEEPLLAPNSFGYVRLEDEGGIVRRYADRVSPLTLAKWAWIAGGAVLGGALLGANLRFARRLKRSRRRLEAPDMPIPVYVAGLPSPCLFGLFRPAVYVTEEVARDPAMLRHVLAHELTHYRHRDHLWSVLRGAALAVHWWNPLVWLAVSLSRRDGELACDEGALRALGEGERTAYGKTLLSLVTARAAPRDLLSFATTMSGGKRSLRERITRIACQPKQLVSAVAAAVLLLALAGFLAFGRVERSAPAPMPGDEEWQSARITLDGEGVPHIRYTLPDGVKDLTGNPIPPPREWADQGRETPAFSREIRAELVSPTEGWLVASDDREADVYIYRTADGGMNWTQASAPDLDRAIADVGFVGPDRLIVAQRYANGAPVYQTRDGGASWELINLPWTDAEVDAIYVSGSSIQMQLFGDGSSVWTMTSDDYGDTWTHWDNAGLDVLLSELTAEDIGEDISADREEIARILRETSPHRESRLYTGEGDFSQTGAWIWCETEGVLPLRAGGKLHMAASYRNQTDVMIGWRTDKGLQYAIYRSAALHELTGRIGKPYYKKTLPETPDLNRDGRPDQIRLRSNGTDQCLQFLMETENGRETWEETALFGSGTSIYLVRMDGEDCVLRYTRRGAGYPTDKRHAYRYQLFYMQNDVIELVQENAIQFDLNFDRNGTDQHSFDPRAIAAFMDEVNGLLEKSTCLLNADKELARTFQREGRLYDSLSWMGVSGSTRVGFSEEISILERLQLYRNLCLFMEAMPSVKTVMREITAEDIVSTGHDGAGAQELAQVLNSAAQGRKGGESGFQETGRRLEAVYTRAGDPGEQTLLLEAGERENLVRVTISGTYTALQYEVNPTVEGTYLQDVPYEFSEYLEDEALYQWLMGLFQK